MKWTNKEIELLVGLTKKGKHADEIAQKLGRSYYSVFRKQQSLNMKYYDFVSSREVRQCKYCKVKFETIPSDSKKFCTQSCSTTFNNKNKTYGIKRSKLERYCEEKLTIDFPNLPILFNSKNAVGSELDIYCPTLKLAIELSGIVHYEPIYGTEKLERIQKNDQNKAAACYDNGIELAIVNTADHSYVTRKTSEKYYKIVKQLVQMNIQRHTF